MPEVVRPADVGDVNWIDPPYNRWAFRHVRELTRTARIGRGAGPVRPLPHASSPIDLGGITFAHGARPWTVTEALATTHTDAFLVLHRGELVSESYFDGMRPDDTHLLMSVSKSLTSVLAGVFVRAA